MFLMVSHEYRSEKTSYFASLPFEKYGMVKKMIEVVMTKSVTEKLANIFAYVMETSVSWTCRLNFCARSWLINQCSTLKIKIKLKIKKVF